MAAVTVGGCAVETDPPPVAAPVAAPAAPAAVVPSGARMIALGKLDDIVLSAPNGGTLYFVDDHSGELVYTLPYPPGERPFRLAEAPEEFKAIFKKGHTYRIYLAKGWG
jgi:hypothetical protein